MPPRNKAKMILTAGILAGAALLATGCETTNTRSTLSSAMQLGEAESFDNGAGKPPTARTLYRMANILAAQDKLAGAESVYRSTIRRYPEFLPAYSELARLQVRRGETDGAIATFDQALIVAPDDAVVHNNRGMCLMLLERYEQARESFAVAAALAPTNTRYDANHALATGMLGEYDEALALYDEFLMPSRAHHNLGVICEARDDYDRAAIEFAKAEGRVLEPAIPEDAQAADAAPAAGSSGDAVEMGAQ